MATIKDDAFFVNLEKAVEYELRLVSERIMTDALSRIEAEMQKKLGQIALSVLREYNIQTQNQHLVITVRHTEGKG